MDLFATLFAISALATPLLARAARRLALLDRAAGPEAARKLQAAGVPPVGGLALVLALVGAGGPAPERLVGALAAPLAAHASAAACTLAGAFLAGFLDDIGLVRRPRAKLVLQVLAAAPLAVGLATGAEAGALTYGLAVLLALVAAQNLANTFDHADGVLGSVACLGLWIGAPAVAGCVLGFLPWNLNGGRGPRAVPTAYLGDGGSHLLGTLLVLVTGGWAALFLPAIDLARLVSVRLRAGSRPWIGDRRHLAHGLQRRGWGSGRIVVGLVLATAPACLAVARAGDGPIVIACGFGASVAAYLALLTLSEPLRVPARG